MENTIENKSIEKQKKDLPEVKGLKKNDSDLISEMQDRLQNYSPETDSSLLFLAEVKERVKNGPKKLQMMHEYAVIDKLNDDYGKMSADKVVEDFNLKKNGMGVFLNPIIKDLDNTINKEGTNKKSATSIKKLLNDIINNPFDIKAKENLKQIVDSELKTNQDLNKNLTVAEKNKNIIFSIFGTGEENFIPSLNKLKDLLENNKISIDNIQEMQNTTKSINKKDFSNEQKPQILPTKQKEGNQL